MSLQILMNWLQLVVLVILIEYELERHEKNEKEWNQIEINKNHQEYNWYELMDRNNMNEK